MHGFSAPRCVNRRADRPSRRQVSWRARDGYTASIMSRPLLLIVLIVAAMFSRCDEPHPPAPKPKPRPGDRVELRGTLSDDVDCRLFKLDDGTVYSLSARLPSYINGTRLCIVGTISETSQCLAQPTIEVQQVKAWSSCP